MPVTVTKTLKQLLPATDIFLMFGLTEAFRGTYLPPDEIVNRPESIGQAIPNVTIDVMRPNGEKCNPEEVGEIVQGGPLVAMGYWNDPEATAAKFRKDEAAGDPDHTSRVWSGDYGYYDKQGYLYFAGRRDDLIKSQGFRISPNEVEDILYQSGYISEAVVIGIRDGTKGHSIVAFLSTSHVVTESQVLKHCKTQMASYMVPDKFIFIEDFPRNQNNKIDRRALASQYREKRQE